MTKERLRKLIGENIRNERIKRGMSIDELAELMGFSSSFVGLMERGRRGVTAFNIYKLAEIFGLSVERFFQELPGRIAMEEPDNTKQKCAKLLTLTYNLSDLEMEFIISTVKNLRTLKDIGEIDSAEGDDEE